MRDCSAGFVAYSNPATEVVRLMGSGSSLQGRVEIYHNGERFCPIILYSMVALICLMILYLLILSLGSEEKSKKGTFCTRFSKLILELEDPSGTPL